MVVLILWWIASPAWWFGPWTLVTLVEPINLLEMVEPSARLGIAMMVGGASLSLGSWWVRQQWFSRGNGEE